MKAKFNFKKTVTLLLIVCVLVVSLPGLIGNAYTEWAISDSTNIYWVSTADSRSDDAVLEKQVQLFAQELEAKELGSLAIKFGPLNSAGVNDIVLYLDSNLTDIPEEGYKIEVGSVVKISASDADGLFYGCRYVLQHLITKSGLTIGSTYVDSPDVSERGVSLDCGRKYWTKDWIINLIREMSWYNMNALTLHFSEDMGIRLEHPYAEYSWLVGSDNSLSSQNGVSHQYSKDNAIVTETYQCNDADQGKYLTIAELKEIVEVANLYHVEIIPSFDSPGHMTYAIEKYKEQYREDIGAWFYVNGEPYRATDNNPTGTSYSIDLSNQTAVDFTRNVIKGYAELFLSLGCTKFDMGGDELLGGSTITVDGTQYYRWMDCLPTWAKYAQEKTGNSAATAYDAFLLYMNDTADMLWEMGYESVRMWNDEAYRTYDTGWTAESGVVQLNENIEINFWKKNVNNGNNTVYTYLDQGHNVYNYYNDFNYYVVKPNGVYPLGTYDLIYQYWTPFVFKANFTTTNTGYVYDSIAVEVTDEAQKQQVKGSAFCIWCDCPDFKTEQEALEDTLNCIRAHGAKAWGVDSVDLTAFATQVVVLGVCPGTAGSYGSVALPAAKEVTDVVEMDELYSAIDTTPDESKYTTDSLAAYKEAKAAAEVLLSEESLTQAQIDAAVEAMNSALVLKGDPTGLQNAVNEYASYDAANYTAASYQRYSDAVSEGKAVLAKDANNVGVEEYANAENAVKDARNALVNIESLNSVIAAYEATDSSNYTVATFAEYTAAVEAARALLAEGQDPTQAEVDSAVQNIQSAREALTMADGACEVLGHGFRTTRVRNGGRAVIWLNLSKEPSSYKITDEKGNEITDFDVVSLGDDTEDGTIYRYLRFTVNSDTVGAKTYTVTIDNGEQATCTLYIWRENK